MEVPFINLIFPTHKYCFLINVICGNLIGGIICLLFKQVLSFQRCIRCNGLLEPVEKAAIIDQIPGKPACKSINFIAVKNVVKFIGVVLIMRRCKGLLKKFYQMTITRLSS
jgi:phage FluMu protein Com